MGVLFGILTMITWGFADFLAAKAVKKLGTLAVFWWSQLVGIVIFLFLYFSFFQFPNISATTFILILLGAFLTLGSFLFFYKGLREGKISIVSPVTSSWAALTVIMSLFFLNEHLGTWQGFGVGFAIVGAILVAFQWSEFIKIKKLTLETGVHYALIASVFAATHFIVFDLLVPELGWFLTILFFRIVAFIFLNIYVGIFRKNIGVSRQYVPSILLIGFLEAAAILAYGYAVSQEYTAVVAPVSSTFPMVTVILASIFLKEKLQLNQKIGIAGILAGLVLISL